jgi:hypothetical protein
MSERGKFPSPYVNTTKENDPIMKRVDPDNLEIGARKSGMPKGIKNGNNLEHVGNSTGGKGR